MSPPTNRQARIEAKLRAKFAPTLLMVRNESDGHNVPRGSETHFRVTLASAAFRGQSAVARHRAVYAALADELASGLHALALDLWSDEEWMEKGAERRSPPCAGGEPS
jgi:BolA protein